MECHEVRLRLVRYLDNDLPARDHEAVEAHLEHCYLCHEEVNEIVTVLDTCRDTLRHPHPVDRFESIQAEIRQHASAAPRRPLPFRPLASALAAAALLLVILSVGAPFVRAAERIVTIVDRARAADAQETVAEPRRDAPPSALVWQQRILWARGLAENATPPAEEPEQENATKANPPEPSPVSRADTPRRMVTARRCISCGCVWS